MPITNLQEALPMVHGERAVFDKDRPHALKAFESSYLLVTHMRG